MNSRPQPNSRTASDGNSALSNRATGQAGYRRGFSSEIGTGEGSGMCNFIQTRVAISASPFREGTVLRGAVSKETPTMIRQIIIAEIGFQFGFVLVTLFAAS
jgi:hypothetical protein